MEKMADKKNAPNYGGQVIYKAFLNLKLEDAPARRRPNYLKTKKPRGTKYNGAGYVSKKHEATHKMRRDIKNQDIEKEHTTNNSTKSLKIGKPIEQENSKALRPDIGIKMEIAYPLHLKSIKTEHHSFNSPNYPVDESQQNKVDYRSDVKTDYIKYLQLMKNLLFMDSESTELNDNKNKQKVPSNQSDIQPPLNYNSKMQNGSLKDTERKRDTMNKYGEKPPSTQLITLKPSENLYLPCCLVKKEINSEEDLFSALHTFRIISWTGCKLIMSEYNWSEESLQLVQGLNILATCKNFKCSKYLKGVVCPRGWFPEQNGYCPLDEEVFNATCPVCKIGITPDDSLGFGFYNCGFQLTYKLHKQPKHITEIKKKENTLYFGKYRPLNDLLDILRVRMSV